MNQPIGQEVQVVRPTERSDSPGQLKEVLTRNRENYIGWLKGMRRSTGEADPNQRRDLSPQQHGLMYLLRNIESFSSIEKPLAELLEGLEKVSLSQLISEKIGHRPTAFTFNLADTDGNLPLPQAEEWLSRGSIYLKQNKAFRGEGVIKISKEGGTYRIYDPTGKVTEVKNLADYKPPKNIFGESTSYIAEEEIPVARTADGKTWEIRFLPPFSTDFAYAKVAAEKSHTNNIARGGERRATLEILEEVIAAKYPELSKEEITLKAQQFVDQARGLSERVKTLTDEYLYEIATAIIKPEDFRDPTTYETTMREAFSGTFLTVDITGRWNYTGQLIPMIIEAQPSAGLPPQTAFAAYRQCLDSQNEKIALVQAVLK